MASGSRAFPAALGVAMTIPDQSKTRAQEVYTDRAFLGGRGRLRSKAPLRSQLMTTFKLCALVTGVGLVLWFVDQLLSR